MMKQLDLTESEREEHHEACRQANEEWIRTGVSYGATIGMRNAYMAGASAGLYHALKILRKRGDD